MGELGSIFEADQREREGRVRGPDLHVTVDVPRNALGVEDGFRAAIPEAIEHEGTLVARAPSPDGEAGLQLFLPPSLPDGAILRLRGQGGVHPNGVAGDLMVRIQLVDPAPRSIRPLVVAILAVTMLMIAAIVLMVRVVA